jgi:hypothetical protein
MPVQHVELRRRHAVDLAFDIRQRDKVARRIEQQPAPREARRIFNGDPRHRGVFRPVLHQLEQRFHGAQRAEAGVGGDNAVGVHRELIAFIAVRQRLRLHLFSDGDADGRFVWLFSLRLQRPAGLQGDALAQRLTASPRSSPLTLSDVVAEHQRAWVSGVRPSQARASAGDRLPGRQSRGAEHSPAVKRLYRNMNVPYLTGQKRQNILLTCAQFVVKRMR